MKTQQRILKTALALFNKNGESNTSTVDIATALNISPGNLYYHFSSKEDIILTLIEDFEAKLSELLEMLALSLIDILEDDLVLKSILEVTWQYRFLYRDMHAVSMRNKEIAKRLLRLRQQTEQGLSYLIESYHLEKIILIPPTYVTSVTQQMLLLCTSWFLWLKPDLDEKLWLENEIEKTCKQMRSLLVPWLQETNEMANA